MVEMYSRFKRLQIIMGAVDYTTLRAEVFLSTLVRCSESDRKFPPYLVTDDAAWKQNDDGDFHEDGEVAQWRRPDVPMVTLLAVMQQ